MKRTRKWTTKKNLDGSASKDLKSFPLIENCDPYKQEQRKS